MERASILSRSNLAFGLFCFPQCEIASDHRISVQSRADGIAALQIALRKLDGRELV